MSYKEMLLLIILITFSNFIREASVYCHLFTWFDHPSSSLVCKIMYFSFDCFWKEPVIQFVLTSGVCKYFSRSMTKPTKWRCVLNGKLRIQGFFKRTAKALIRLGGCGGILWSDWADAQADLSLRMAHMPFCWFCHAAAHFTWFFMSLYTVPKCQRHVICFWNSYRCYKYTYPAQSISKKTSYITLILDWNDTNKRLFYGGTGMDRRLQNRNS